MDAESKINFIPCIRWVRQGAAKRNPEKVQLTKEELVQIINETKSKLKVTVENEEGTPHTGASTSMNDEFNFEKYDEDQDGGENALGISELAEASADAGDNFADSDDSDQEDDIIKPTDNLILAGRVDGDCSILEIYVHNEEESSLYVHHDLILPAFPLCIEWLDHEPGSSPGNYCMIGSMNPVIDVWDLDVVNCLEPAYSLGRPASRKKGLSHVGHEDAVLGLAWNSIYHHILASGSVDQTVILWDLDRGEPSTTIRSFTDKVQCLEWHRLEAQTLLAGGCDKTARVFDCRNPESHQTWPLNGEAERVTWNPLEPFSFLTSTSTGMVQCFDCRKGELWSIETHTKEVTGLAVSGQCPGLMVTTSSDGALKVWDFKDVPLPVLIHEKDFGLGSVQCLELCPDLPFLIAAGGDKKSNNFAVLDLLSFESVKQKFGSRQLIQLVTEETT